MQSAIGLSAFVGICWLLSENRRIFPIRIVVVGLYLQGALAALFLSVKPVQDAFFGLNRLVLAVSEATKAGTAFVFGYLGGGPLPYAESFPGASFVLAFQALPIILVMSALSSLLFYWGVLPLLVKAFSWALRRTMGVGGAVGVSTAANIFVGMVEAPLFIRPYLAKLSRSELFVVMTTGLAGVAGTVMVLYATFLAAIPNALGHILLASVLTAPSSIVVAKLMIPESGQATEGDIVAPDDVRSSMDAITRGTLAGVELLINVTAMLIVLVALVSLLNSVLALLPDMAGQPVSLQRILGHVMAPVVWAMGVPWSEAAAAGQLMGVKTVLNEFIAYVELSKLPADTLSDRSRLIMLYGLCGFANFGSVGIMIGGLATMAPARRGEIVDLGLKSLVSGTISTAMTASIVSFFV